MHAHRSHRVSIAARPETSQLIFPLRIPAVLNFSATAWSTAVQTGKRRE
jgi:hypothetical protein